MSDTVQDLRSKLREAHNGLAKAQQAQKRAEQLSEVARDLGGGLLSFGGSGNQAARRRVQGAQGRAFQAHAEAEERIRYWTGRISSLERRIQEAARIRLTADDLKGATHVRSATTWHKVVRVNAQSVTVATPFSWTSRIPIDQIREFRIITEVPSSE
ncbi:hypothetical protein [Microbacterium sp. NPDC055455]